MAPGRRSSGYSVFGLALKAVTMRPFGRDVVAVEAAMVILPVTDARALLKS
jgi:hypothetical protein